MAGSDVPSPLRLAHVPGVSPGKWVRTWRERQPEVELVLLQVAAAEAEALVRERGADAVLLRLPIDRTGLSAIPLYTETTVVVFPKDHHLAAADADAELAVEDIADDVVLHPRDDVLDWDGPPGRPAVERPATTGDAVALVAAGVGLLVVPQSLARLHHRRDLTYRAVAGVPASQVALSWLAEETTDDIETFVGIVRGRTVNSSRGRQAPDRAVKVVRARPNADQRRGGRRANTRRRRG